MISSVLAQGDVVRQEGNALAAARQHLAEVEQGARVERDRVVGLQDEVGTAGRPAMVPVVMAQAPSLTFRQLLPPATPLLMLRLSGSMSRVPSSPLAAVVSTRP